MKRSIELDNSDEDDLSAGLERMNRWNEDFRLYREHLETIAQRLGPKAYAFFQFGWADTGLHDGLLLSLSFGDDIGFTGTEPPKLKFGQGKTVLEMKIVNYDLDTLHVFTFKGLHSVVIDVPSQQPLWFQPGKNLGSIHSYEVISTSPELLRIEWLLDSGGTIVIDFEKLLYKTKRLRAKPSSQPAKSKRL